MGPIDKWRVICAAVLPRFDSFEQMEFRPEDYVDARVPDSQPLAGPVHAVRLHSLPREETPDAPGSKSGHWEQQSLFLCRDGALLLCMEFGGYTPTSSSYRVGWGLRHHAEPLTHTPLAEVAHHLAKCLDLGGAGEEHFAAVLELDTRTKRNALREYVLPVFSQAACAIPTHEDSAQWSAIAKATTACYRERGIYLGGGSQFQPGPEGPGYGPVVGQSYYLLASGAVLVLTASGNYVEWGPGYEWETEWEAEEGDDVLATLSLLQMAQALRGAVSTSPMPDLVFRASRYLEAAHRLRWIERFSS